MTSKIKEILKNVLLAVIYLIGTAALILLLIERTSNVFPALNFVILKLAAAVAAIAIFRIGKICNEKGYLPEWFTRIIKVKEE